MTQTDAVTALYLLLNVTLVGMRGQAACLLDYRHNVGVGVHIALTGMTDGSIGIEMSTSRTRLAQYHISTTHVNPYSGMRYLENR